MPSCCIRQCSARKNINQPELTLHRFPVNEIAKKQWLEVVGIENINPRHKIWYVCSMHFDESCFNRTLDVTRLRDGAIPSLFLQPTRASYLQPSTEDCSGTINFINIMNDVFDVLNSHSVRPPGWKKAMCPQNIGFIRALFETAIDYINSLKLPSGEVLIASRRKTGFIGLIIDMKSALVPYEHLVEETQILKYVPLYKISPDHLELFFSAVRWLQQQPECSAVPGGI